MTDSMAESADDVSVHAGDDASAILHAVEPPSALLIGGALGGATFLLCALLFGARVAIVMAALGALVALMRRLRVAAAGFAIAAAIAAAGSTQALLVSSAIFGIALALFARARMRERVVGAIRR